MKKLSLLLLTLCISLAGWATDNDDTPGLEYTLNPYAYDLKIKSWDESSQTLTVQFKLNAPPNLNGDEYNKVTDIEPNGIQIFAVDPQGNRYRIAGPGRDVIKTAHVNNNGQYELRIDLSTAKSVGGNNPDVDIPKNVPLTWEVQVKGRNNTATKGRKSPTLVFTDITTKNSLFYPRAAHGIAIEKTPLNPHFGKIFVADACIDHLKAAGYKYNGSALLIYDPHLKYTDYELKVKYEEGKMNGFSTTVNYEPHRVCVSEDGRVFVTCYNPDADAIVMELVGNDNFRTIIKADKAQNKDETVIRSADGNNTLLYPADTKYNDRPIAMDVKKTDEGLKILVAMLTPKGKIATKGTNRRVFSKITCYEYTLDDDDVNVEQYNLSNGKCKVVAEFYDVATDGTNDGSSQGEGMLFQCVFNDYNSIKQGLINVKYGEGENNPIWMKVDFGFSKNEGRNGRILYFDNTGSNPTVPKYTYLIPVSYCNANAMYGGGGMYIKGNQLLTGSGNNSVLFFNINNSNSVPNLTYNTSLASGSRGTGAWIDAFAEDFAGNIYALSEAADNIIVIAMPYDGVRRTPSPAGQTFTLSDPVPNILATDLRYDIVRGKNQYEFSFNVNTKPEEAQIRFYSSYDAMKNSLNVVNADNYDGTNANKPVYVYNIPDDQLKQGRIAVKLGAVGGQADANGVITNDRLPAGVLYWSVYVKTRKSNAFAPTCRLEGINDAQGAHRRYATVNNYPETDMFGSFIVADCPTVNSVNGPYNGLMIYGINPDGNSNDEQSDISNGVRYSHRESYLNSGVASASDKLNFPRRLVVAPDGRVFIADQGTTDAADYAGATTVVQHVRGGVRIWDPADPKKFTLFSHNKIGTSFGVSLWEHPAANGGLKIYASNAYEEYLKHNTTNNYTDQQKDGIFGWNGLAEYTLSAHPNGSENWSNPDSVHYALGRGDASGNYSLVAMDKGIWMCQHREHNRQLKDEALQPLADNLDAVLLSFFPYGSTKAETWNSCTTNGVNNYDDATKRAERADASDLTQKRTSPIQSTPGAGMAYRKIDGKEYLFVVNHDGNIAQILIDGWTGSGATATPTIDASKVKILVTPAYTKGDRDVDNTSTKWHTAFITTINFDYAGNLVTTTGKSFGQAHDIIVYTMPYNRVNAREIQAPNSCRMIPERIAQLDMNKEDLDELIEEHQRDHLTGCAIDLYRPLQGGMFNTICLPCTLDLKTLPEGHPLYEAELKEYTGLNLNTVGGEKVLELVFEDVSNKVVIANVPYIIEPKDDYNSIIRFAGPLRLTNTTGEAVNHEENSKNYNITYQGIIPFQNVEPKKDLNTGEILTLMLVADNRLAAMTVAGPMYGFRGYFELNQPLPKGMQTRITTSKGTTTNTTIVVDGKKVNVEKFLQEGRVYIRMGDSLYTITGEKVE